MTNFEYLKSCNKSDMADALTWMIVNVVEQLTGVEVTREQELAEFKTMLLYLEMDAPEQVEYIN